MHKRNIYILDKVSTETECILKYFQIHYYAPIFIVQIGSNQNQSDIKRLKEIYSLQYFNIEYDNLFANIIDLEESELVEYANSIIDILILNRVIVKRKVNIIFENFSFSFLSLVLKRRLKCDVYSFVNYLPNNEFSSKKKWMALRVSDFIICANKIIRNLIQATLESTTNRIITFPLLIESKSFTRIKMKYETIFKLPDKRKLVVFYLLNTEEEYINAFLKALIELKHSRISYNVILLGADKVSYMNEKILEILPDITVISKLNEELVYYLFSYCDLLISLQKKPFVSFRSVMVDNKKVRLLTFNNYLNDFCRERCLKVPTEIGHDSHKLVKHITGVLRSL